MTKRFAVTKDLHSPKYRQRVVASKKHVKREAVCSSCDGHGVIWELTSDGSELVDDTCHVCGGSGVKGK